MGSRRQVFGSISSSSNGSTSTAVVKACCHVKFDSCSSGATQPVGVSFSLDAYAVLQQPAAFCVVNMAPCTAHHFPGKGPSASSIEVTCRHCTLPACNKSALTANLIAAGAASNADKLIATWCLACVQRLQAHGSD